MTNDHVEDKAARQTQYDVVVVTRNRPQALAMSLPLVRKQTRQPRKIIIVDASDDHESTRKAINEALRGWAGDVVIQESEKGISKQRNVGAKLSSSDVVVFIDDDSLPFADAFEEMMRIYDRDANREVVGVCAADSSLPPFLEESTTYKKSWQHRVQYFGSRGAKRRIFRRFRFDQFEIMGNYNVRKWNRLEWIKYCNAALVPWMTGYRMSFRRDELMRTGFDENLTGYSLFEDTDISLRIARFGALIGARSSKIHHYRFPGPREDPFIYGRKQAINRAYVVAKNWSGRDEVEATKSIGKSSLFYLFVAKKIIQRLPFIWNSWYRQEAAGLIAAIPGARAILRAGERDLAKVYFDAVGGENIREGIAS